MKSFETTTSLMKHQDLAANKIQPTRVGGLFMDMGTGKSRTAIELVQRRLEKIDQVVWFCPVSLKETVEQEILKHTNCKDVYVFDHKTNTENLPKARWNVIGIESMSSSSRVIFSAKKIINEGTKVILDESSFIKGHRSLRTQRITLLSEIAKYRMILTGRPLSQGVVDLFAQMRFLSPKILGYDSFYSFARNHLEYSDKYPGMIVRSHNIPYLASKIQPYIYQVTKEECLDLPKKLYETRYFSMTDEQRYWYERVKEEILLEIDPDEVDSYIIFKLFTALQQVVSGYLNRDGNIIEFPSQRTERMLDVIEDIPKDKKIIIFAKYQYDVRNIQRHLEERYGKDSTSVYAGYIPERKRGYELEKFRREAKFFVATQSSGGYGLTLNESHYQIFYNNSFKYIEREQAEDRNHRIGQDQDVTYIDLRCTRSIDDRIAHSLNTKGDTVEAFRREINKVKDSKVKLKELIMAL